MNISPVILSVIFTHRYQRNTATSRLHDIIIYSIYHNYDLVSPPRPTHNLLIRLTAVNGNTPDLNFKVVDFSKVGFEFGQNLNGNPTTVAF